MYQFIFGFILAVISFHVNHKISRVVNIKILINTLFDVYGKSSAMFEYNSKDIANILTNEILSVEKLHDNNPYVKIQINKLKQLHKIYHNHNGEELEESIESKILRWVKLL